MILNDQKDLNAMNDLGTTLLRLGLSGVYCESVYGENDADFSHRLSTNVGRKPTNDGMWQWGKGISKGYRNFGEDYY